MKSTSMELIYYDDISKILPKLDNNKELSYLISPLHNQDKKESGELKKAHYHIYLHYNDNQARSFERVARELSPDGVNILPENISKIKGSLRDCKLYATHNNRPDKYQYNEADIITNDIHCFERGEKVENKKDDNSFDILDEMLAGGGYNLYNLAKKYGKDFIYHYGQFKSLYQDIRHYRADYEEREWLRTTKKDSDEITIEEINANILKKEVFKNEN